MTPMPSDSLTAQDLPAELAGERAQLLLDLHRLWMRQSDLRFGQLLRRAVHTEVARLDALGDEALAAGVAHALTELPERPLSPGPFWDTETLERDSFRQGLPRDPLRIAQLLKTLARAWTGHPGLTLGQLLDRALDRANIPENEFGTRWLLIEDRPLERTLEALEDDPRPRPAQPRPRRTRSSNRSAAHRQVAAERAPTPGPVTPVAIVHAGAGALHRQVAGHESGCRQCLREAVENSRVLLERGEDALRAAKTAVQIMEDFPLFNAGYGSALCDDGTVQMSAALMRGSDRRAGAVAGITTVKHPIIAALTVFDSPHVLLIGPHADRHALERGAERWLNEDFVTDRQRRRLCEARPISEHGTVGAVCLDTHGVVAAATSTGGLIAQPPGRVGDTPLIGAGTWADQRVAISCTGDGEAFIRVGAAARLATLVECGTPLADAADRVLAEVAALGGSGGLIAVDGGYALQQPHALARHLAWRFRARSRDSEVGRCPLMIDATAGDECRAERLAVTASRRP